MGLNPLGKFAAWLNQTVNKPKAPGAVYAGAQYTRLTENWYAAVLSADRELKNSLRTLRSRSRQLVRDNPHFAGFVADLKTNIIGWESDGIGIQARNKKADGTFDDAVNEAIEEAFCEWGFPETCSADGQDSWGDLQRHAVGLLVMDGEILLRRLPGFDNPYSYALQLLDADQLDETYSLAASPGQNEIRMGVEVDQYGRPTAYWLWSRHPNDLVANRTRIRVPAEEIIHIFVRLRPGQSRGIPWFTPVLLPMHMLDGYTEAEVVQSRLAASGGGFFETVGAENIEAAPVLKADAEGATVADRLTMESEPGLARALPPGMTFKPWDPTHPNGNFAGFQKAMLRTIARGCNPFGTTSYSTFSGDLEAVNYSSIRAGIISERDAFRVFQRFLTTRLHRLVYRDVLRYGALTGAVPVPGFNSAKYTACTYEYRGWQWVDPVKEMEAATGEVRLGVQSRQNICAERGRDFEDMVEQLAEEQRIAKAAGVDISGLVNAKPLDNTDAGATATPPGGPKESGTTDDDEELPAAHTPRRLAVLGAR